MTTIASTPLPLAAAKKGDKKYEKYSLRPRSIQKRIETEKRAAEPKKVSKPKQRAPPLSKYRRKTANARERTRMKEINVAFDALQSVVPAYPVLPVNAQGKTCEKLTKITTLRLAMKYIEGLNRLLKSPEDAATASGTAGLSSFTAGTFAHFDDDLFRSLSPSGSSSSSSAFSPASSSSFSLSPCPPSLPPDCIQTVMRSVVQSPARRNVPHTQTVYTPPPVPYYLTQSSYPMSQKGPSYMESVPQPLGLKYNHGLLNQSVCSLLAECGGGGNRAGSLSSLTESDLSEYASDLLSDEGSTLDDPMFDDLMGVVESVGGTVEDLEHLILESDGDSLHFSSGLSDT